MTLKATTERPKFLPPVLLLSADDSLSREIQVLKVGAYNHPKYGRFKITPEDLLSFKANFEKNVREIETVINFDHGDSKAHGNEAAGWIRSLALKADGKELWAEPEWTPDAETAVKAKKWKYTSAEIVWTWKHPETEVTHSRVLTGLAITNQPFIKGMNAIAASDNNDDHHNGDHPMKLNELEAMLLSEHGLNLADLRSRAGLVSGLETKVTQLSETVKTAEDKAKALLTDNATLSQKLDLAEKAGDEVKFQALVVKGMTEGKLTKAFAEGRLTAIFKASGLKFAEDLVTDMPKMVPVDDGKGHDGGKDEKGGAKKFKDPSAEVTHRATELMAKDAKLSFSGAASKVLDEDKKLARRYSEWEGEGADGEADED